MIRLAHQTGDRARQRPFHPGDDDEDFAWLEPLALGQSAVDARDADIVTGPRDCQKIRASPPLPGDRQSFVPRTPTRSCLRFRKGAPSSNGDAPRAFVKRAWENSFATALN